MDFLCFGKLFTFFINKYCDNMMGNYFFAFGQKDVDEFRVRSHNSEKINLLHLTMHFFIVAIVIT